MQVCLSSSKGREFGRAYTALIPKREEHAKKNLNNIMIVTNVVKKKKKKKVECRRLMADTPREE